MYWRSRKEIFLALAAVVVVHRLGIVVGTVESSLPPMSKKKTVLPKVQNDITSGVLRILQPFDNNLVLPPPNFPTQIHHL